MNRELDEYFREVEREVSAVQEALADRALMARVEKKYPTNSKGDHHDTNTR